VADDRLAAKQRRQLARRDASRRLVQAQLDPLVGTSLDRGRLAGKRLGVVAKAHSVDSIAVAVKDGIANTDAM
jgi:hypothetical protein